MLTENQHTEIRNYLLSKKLPIDILMEVNDHFLSQINDLMNEKNLSFGEAFKETQLNWNKDLKLYWNGSADLEDKTDLARKVTREALQSVLNISTKTAVLGTLFTLGFVYLLPKSIFVYALITLVLALLFLPSVYYFYRYKDFRLAKKYDNYTLTYFQNYAVGGTFLIVVSSQILIRIHELSTHFYDLFHPLVFGWSLFLMLIGLFILFLSSVFIIIAQKKYLERIEKVKPFLKYLKPSL
ncbi:MAG: hypothetical protein Q4G16_03675 [Cruoricaptor ignavus]|nr:hypothetical protein [Cruoricaptor ignavus]